MTIELPSADKAVKTPVAHRQIIFNARKKRVERISVLISATVVGALAVIVTVAGALKHKEHTAARISARSWIAESATVYSYDAMQLIVLINIAYAKSLAGTEDAQTFVELSQNQLSAIATPGALIHERLKLEHGYGNMVTGASKFIAAASSYLSRPGKQNRERMSAAYDEALSALQTLRSESERRESQSRDLVVEMLRYNDWNAVLGVACMILASAAVIGMARWVRALERSWTLAEEASQKQISMFLASIGHDIRSPLQTVITAAGLLKSPIPDYERNDYAAAIKSACNRIAGLVNDLYALANVGTIAVNNEAIDISPFVARLLIGHRMDALNKGLVWSLDTTRCLNRTVLCDPNRMAQIIDNIVGNAVKYTEKGSIEIVAAFLPDAHDPCAGQFYFSVADTGVGMPESELSSIWDPFYRLRRDGKLADGSGLGLATVLMLVERLEGKIWVESTDGIGSTFSLTLPMTAAQRDNTPIRRANLTDSESVLVVDDEPHLRNSLAACLQQAGFDANAAGDARTALAMLQEKYYDVIVTDLQMPGVTGYEFARIVRESLHPHPAIVAISGRLQDDDDTKSLFDLMLIKPVDEEVIVDALEEIFVSRQLARGLKEDHLEQTLDS